MRSFIKIMWSKQNQVISLDCVQLRIGIWMQIEDDPTCLCCRCQIYKIIYIYYIDTNFILNIGNLFMYSLILLVMMTTSNQMLLWKELILIRGQPP